MSDIARSMTRLRGDHHDDAWDHAMSCLATMETHLREAHRLLTTVLHECPCRDRPGVVTLQDRCPRCRILAEALIHIIHTL